MGIASSTLMLLVETLVAIAFGASVHPLTKVTANVRISVTSNIGFESSSVIKLRRLRSGI